MHSADRERLADSIQAIRSELLVPELKPADPDFALHLQNIRASFDELKATHPSLHYNCVKTYDTMTGLLRFSGIARRAALAALNHLESELSPLLKGAETSSVKMLTPPTAAATDAAIAAPTISSKDAAILSLMIIFAPYFNTTKDAASSFSFFPSDLAKPYQSLAQDLCKALTQAEIDHAKVKSLLSELKSDPTFPGSSAELSSATRAYHEAFFPSNRSSPEAAS